MATKKRNWVIALIIVFAIIIIIAIRIPFLKDGNHVGWWFASSLVLITVFFVILGLITKKKKVEAETTKNQVNQIKEVKEEEGFYQPRYRLRSSPEGR